VYPQAEQNKMLRQTAHQKRKKERNKGKPSPTALRVAMKLHMEARIKQGKVDQADRQLGWDAAMVIGSGSDCSGDEAPGSTPDTSQSSLLASQSSMTACQPPTQQSSAGSSHSSSSFSSSSSSSLQPHTHIQAPTQATPASQSAEGLFTKDKAEAEQVSSVIDKFSFSCAVMYVCVSVSCVSRGVLCVHFQELWSYLDVNQMDVIRMETSKKKPLKKKKKTPIKQEEGEAKKRFPTRRRTQNKAYSENHQWEK
jgi:hypothetical protein